MDRQPLYEQGFIVVPHLGTLGFSIGRGGEIRSIYSYFLSSALHLICSAFLSLGGIYHAIFGREVLEETHFISTIFGDIAIKIDFV